MNEETIRQIVRDEMRKNYMSGSPNVPPHSHNGTDGLNISPANIEGFTPLPTTGTYLNNLTGLYENGFASSKYVTASGLVGGDNTHESQYILDNSVYQYPIPVVVGNGVGNQGAFNGGYAPEGTLVLFAGIANPQLYIRWDGEWRGVELTLTA